MLVNDKYVTFFVILRLCVLSAMQRVYNKILMYGDASIPRSHAVLSCSKQLKTTNPTQPVSMFYETFVHHVGALGSQKTCLVAIIATIFWC